MTDDTDAQARRRRFLAMTEAGKAVLAAEDAHARAAQDARPAQDPGLRGQQGATDESTERRRRFLEMTEAGRAVLAAAAEDAARRGGGGSAR